ncbi:hypothetical protein BS47DRAFT_1373137 [Hydnum rufescens UP504]|uniref:tryptophan--tRNA ligase n=1 Tax=Hydnum rufescens UP504 TaxID=1448309 RepID=A0A9P6ASK2_9AGAM|nr:hypothetical protein BS47DRAFT_1373137 [Hydnum rufescens UP504]
MNVVRRLSTTARAGGTATTRSLGTCSTPRTVFSGIQPTGIPHLGNYLGALSNWVHLQETARSEDTFIYSVVGLHAITVSQDPTKLRRDRLDALTSLLAIGIDPKRSILFFQEDVQEHTELAWILGCLAPIGRLNRMTAYKATSPEASSDERLGLFAYPVLQAADILAYKATHVPVGEDQRQHLELTRDLATPSISNVPPKYSPFPKTPQVPPTKRILSLRDPSQKMSKSSPHVNSRILLTDTSSDIMLKIRKAITDSNFGITYDPINRPGISNLLRILHACRAPMRSHDTALEESEASTRLDDELHGATMASFKEAVADAVSARIGPIREEFARLRADEGYVRQVAREGANKAKDIASRTVREVKERIGLGQL